MISEARRLPEAALLAAVVTMAGCGRAAPAMAPDSAPTFNEDVAPILFQHCATCHRPGQGAPFSLVTYGDVKSRAEKIATVIESRRMPPWLPDPVEPGFVGERRLGARQIEIIQSWVKAGAPEGEPRDLSPMRNWREGWQLGQPDLIVKPLRPFVLQPGQDDVFRNLVIIGPLTSDRFVRAVEFLPGDAPVHHAVVHLDRTASSRLRDGRNGQPGFDGMGAMGTQEPDGHFVGWAPGRGPILSANGMPWRLARGTDLVLELHLLPGKVPVTVQPTIGLYFAGQSSEAAPLMVKLGSKAIDIPAGAGDYAIEDRFTLPVDVDLLSVYPHAHFLGKAMQVLALLPDGRTRTLLQIPRWSFHWQQDYRYTQSIPLPAGTTISMRFTYDNSDQNHDNPHHPPVRVTAGQRSTDEMGNLLLQVVPRSRADRARLSAAFLAHDALLNVAGAEMVARRHPDNAESQIQLGSSYVDVGRVTEGIAHLELALKLDPQSSKAHNELGGALLKLNRASEAVPHFAQAVTLDPKNARLVFNLGKAQAAAGRPAEAAASFEKALSIDGELWEAHDELGALLFAGGRLDAAIAHLRRAVQLAPDSDIALSDLGGALAQAGKKTEALEYLRRALEINPDYAPAKQNLERLGGRVP
jgi:tetratricopeptide (TPR) repeat protein/mono/diheme cytochrome c family protein